MKKKNLEFSNFYTLIDPKTRFLGGDFYYILFIYCSFFYLFFKGKKEEGKSFYYYFFLKEMGQISKRVMIWGEMNPKIEIK